MRRGLTEHLLLTLEVARGRPKILVGSYPLSAAKQAYDDFEHGRLIGRAVLMPEAVKAGDRAAAASSRAPVTAGA